MNWALWLVIHSQRLSAFMQMLKQAYVWIRKDKPWIVRALCTLGIATLAWTFPFFICVIVATQLTMHFQQGKS